MSEAILDYLKKRLANRPARLPDGAGLAWRWFNDLCRTRTGNGYGPNPLSYVEIEAYARLHRWPLEPRHVDLIMAMDRVWMESAAKPADGSADGVARLPKMSDQPLTAAAFDAVFG